MYWPLGLVVAATAAPIVWLSMRFEKRYVVVSRRVQDEQGDLATRAEEGAVGIRVIKSFGRAEHVSGAVRRGRPQAARHEHGQGPALGEVLDLPRGDPQPRGRGRAAARRDRRRPRRAHPGRAGRLHHADALAGLAGRLARRDPGDGAGGDDRGRPHPRDLRHRARHRRRHPGRSSSRAATCASSTSTSPSPAPTSRCCATSTSTIAPGETVALVGATGSGKTILTALVPRLYDVTGGRVTIDGVDVRDLDLAHLRSLVATAFEEPTLFSMSARENLTLGRDPVPTRRPTTRSTRRSSVAQAGFVHDLPWGLDTRIGEQGLALSGGQRQRLALARAVLAQPQVLVLDDTLSALDVHTEKLVEEALRRVLATTTGLVVAHRASTVLLADRVALLQDGTHHPRRRPPRAARHGARPTASCSPPDCRARRMRRPVPQDARRDRPSAEPVARRRPGRRRRGRRADDRRSGSAAARSGCCGELLAPYKRAIQILLVDRPGRERRAARRSPTWSRRASTPASRRSRTSDDLRRCSRSSALVLVATIVQAVARQLFLVRSGRDRPGRPLRDPPPGLPALPGPEPGVPRLLHLGPGDLAGRPPTSTRSTRCSRPASTAWSPPRSPSSAPPACCSSSTCKLGLVALLLRAVPRLADQLVPRATRPRATRSPARRSRW